MTTTTDTTDTLTHIAPDRLATITGGGAAYAAGYAGGWAVTKALEQTPWGSKIVPDPAHPSRQIPQADIPVIGPKLVQWGFPSLGAGATDSVVDLGNAHAR